MHPLANSHCKCQTDFYSVFLTSLCQNGRCSNRLISILYLYQKQHLLWTIQKNPCTLNSKESFMNPSASYSSTELPKKKKKIVSRYYNMPPFVFFWSISVSKHWTTKNKKVSRYYNMLLFILFWSISVSQNPDHEPTTDHGPEFVHTICSNTGKTQTSRKIKLVGARLVHMGRKLFPWSRG